MRTEKADLHKHLQHLQQLHTHCFPGDVVPDWGAAVWWITWDQGEPVAFIGVEPVESWKDALHILRVGVLESRRGRGLQAFLMRKVLKHALGMFTHVISSTYENPASANNFIRCKFKTYLPNYLWGASGTIYWIKELP